MNNLTELIFILDKSGSMRGLEEDTIKGFNSLIKRQKKKDGESLITLAFFNEEIEIIKNRISIGEIKNLSTKDFLPSGCTSLLDTLGYVINHFVNVYKNLDVENKPENILFIITTDGLENSSTKFSYSQIKRLINKTKKENNFHYLFLGANIDSELEAKKLGIGSQYSATYINNSDGVKLNYKILNKAIDAFRIKRKIDKSWKNNLNESAFYNSGE